MKYIPYCIHALQMELFKILRTWTTSINPNPSIIGPNETSISPPIKENLTLGSP